MNKDYNHLIETSIKAAYDGGIAILEVYNTANFEVDFKADNSPLTEADLKAHQAIIAYLNETNIHILSEEGKHDNFETRKNWKTLWIVDPLDGTKEFVKRNGEFTVNIALINDNMPQFGVIYVPVQDTMYFGGIEMKSYKIEQFSTLSWSTIKDLKDAALSLGNNKLPKHYTVVASRSHLSDDTKTFIKTKEETHGTVDTVSMGSSLKICLVAENKAHVYPRYAPTMEWDTAAGQAIAEGAGKTLIDYDTKAPMMYNRKELRNNWFIVE